MKNAVPNPGPEGDHRLEALALHDRRALDVGVVGHAARLANGLGEGPRQVEVRPGCDQLGVGLRAGALLAHEVRRTEDVTLADHARETTGHAVPSGSLATNFVSVETKSLGGIG